MEWELITAPQLKKTAEAGAVCVVPLGCYEKHGPHSPLGTDMIIARGIARRAAEITGDVVFPGFYFGQIDEGRHCPGAVAIEPGLAMRCLQNTVEEIARNGFKKIVLYNCHGGNNAMAPYFLQTQLHGERDYTVYFSNVYTGYPRNGETFGEAMTRVFPNWSKFDFHGGEKETSLVMALAGEETIDRAAIGAPGEPLFRLEHLAGAKTALDWYANFPEHFAGDPRNASRKAGEKIVRIYVEPLADQLKAIRADRVTPELQREYFERVRNLAPPRG